MVIVSLWVNVVVLLPVVLGLLLGARWCEDAYGPRHPARGILLATYAAILVLSAGLLGCGDPRWAVGLLLMQVLYKVMTPWTVGSWRHPVVLSNLAIAALHGVTLTVALGAYAP
ncbi:MAG: hypothetical protein H6838_10530 [Planctomycetes bacterium]|nr:hypothetical protein [Planctomycetota bacterium]MCB9885921.1 hypothetical protein [Planctomycetota bacterium]